MRRIYLSFDCNLPLDVKGVFFYMSKAFDRVRYDGLIHKIKYVEINCMLLKLIKSFLENRFEWEPVLAGVPQDSVLDLLFFLIDINDLSKKLLSNTKLFAGNTSILSTVENISVSADHVNSDSEKIQIRLIIGKCHFILILKKQVQEVIFSRKRVQDAYPSIVFNALVEVFRYSLEKVDFNAHINERINKVNRRISLIRKLQSKLLK